jgi:hypothetical protein
MTRDADRASELLAKITVNMAANAIRPEEDRVDLLAMLSEALRDERERVLGAAREQRIQKNNFKRLYGRAFAEARELMAPDAYEEFVRRMDHHRDHPTLVRALKGQGREEVRS